ncbi:MAG: FAD-binding oxidoreductase [Devosia sp.]
MDLSALRASYSGRLYTEPADMEAFLTDWRRKWTGRALAVAQPDAPLDVAAVLAWCSANQVPVVAQGGNTGLSGGATPDGSGRSLLLSLTRLNRVRNVDTRNNTIEVEAGVTLQQVQDAARDAGRMFPLSLAAQGTCTIGGNLATNAGGVQVLRFGNARELCLGLEVATAQGDLWNGLRGLRKDNSGYDLRDVFIGSEGTLGVITAAVLKLFPLPAAQVAAFVATPNVDAAVQLFHLSLALLGSELTACELVSEPCLQLVEKHSATARRPFGDVSPWYVLLEVSTQQEEASAMAKVEALLETAMEQELATNAVVSTSVAQFKNLWSLREHISEAQAAEGKTIKHDISLPISCIGEFVDSTSSNLTRSFPHIRLICFGHLGDGNLHYNISPHPNQDEPDDVAAFLELEEPINRLVHDAVAARGGSISAEHGLGVLRRDESARFKSDVEMRLMRSLKLAFDPLYLMNPGKVLP